MTDSQQVDAVVVGAGFAGLYQLHALRGLGLTVQVVEAGEGVGGTWFWNRYPGARCDVESASYSFSFSPELEQEWEWTEKYPTQPEILSYLEHVADRFDLRRDIRFSTRVTGAAWDDDERRWQVELDTGETITATYLVMATGCLSVPKAPEVPGIADFAGAVHHTSDWPTEAVDFTGLRVGVIGTGSSGVQSIPVIAAQAAEVVVFQRTATFALPAGNRPLTREESTAMKADYRAWRVLQRSSGFGVPVELPTRNALEDTAEQRAARYEGAWRDGTLISLLTAYKDILTDLAANDTASDFIRGKIKEIVADPQVAEDLSPRTYPVGTKRVCLDSGYYATFNQDHVRLVNVRRTPIERITERGIRTSDQEHELDVIVFATGFDAITGALLAVDIRGRGGVTLRQEWAEGPRTYLGLATAGFPNMFTVTGPSSPSLFSNMVVSLEQHVEWITDCIAFLRDNGLAAAEPTQEAQDGWVEHVARVADATLYPLADSYYLGANVPGKPRVFLCYLGGADVYRRLCDEEASSGYPGFVLHAAHVPTLNPAG